MGERPDLHYVAVVLEDAEDEFSVHFPDLPGCFTRGATRAQVCRFAVETLTAHLERFAAGRVPGPMLRCLDAIRALPAQSRATLMLVEAGY